MSTAIQWKDMTHTAAQIDAAVDAVAGKASQADLEALETTVSGKQDTLTFDPHPESGSDNPIKSGGVYSALGTKQDTLQYDAVPTSGSDNMVKSGGIQSAIASAVSDKITAADILGQGTRIQGTTAEPNDLDNYWMFGNYYIATAADIVEDGVYKILNCPPDVLYSRARILVFQFSGTLASNARCVQVYIPQRLPTTSDDNPVCFYMRYRTTSGSGVVTWTKWFAIHGIPLTPAVNLMVQTSLSPNASGGEVTENA